MNWRWRRKKRRWNRSRIPPRLGANKTMLEDSSSSRIFLSLYLVLFFWLKVLVYRIEPIKLLMLSHLYDVGVYLCCRWLRIVLQDEESLWKHPSLRLRLDVVLVLVRRCVESANPSGNFINTARRDYVLRVTSLIVYTPKNAFVNQNSFYECCAVRYSTLV